MTTYTTADLVKNELRVSTDFSASTVPTLTYLNIMIEQESAQIDKDSARVWGSTAYTDVIDYDGSSVIELKNTPVVSVTSVKYSEYGLGTDNYSLSIIKEAEKDYTTDLNRGQIIPLSRWSPAIGRKRIEVKYTAGFATTPTLIQKLCTKMVALRILNSLIQGNVNEGNDGGSISVGSISIVEPASYGVNSYQNLKKEIDELKREISKGFGVHRYINYNRV